MNASNQAIAKFVVALRVHFPTRHDGETSEAEWLKSIREVIKWFSDDVLERAAQRIIDTRTDRRFPLPAEIRKACNQTSDDKRKEELRIEPPRDPTDPKHISKYPAWAKERVDLADMLVKGEMGRRAANQGWILSLHDFCRKHARLPLHHEVTGIQTSAAEFIEAYNVAVRGGWSQAAELAQLGDKMLAKREALRVMVLGETAA